MTFAQSISTCFRKYSTFQGRATRSEFWWFVLFDALVVLGLVVAGIAMGLSPKGIDLFARGGSLVLCGLPYLAVTTRRLHDVNRNGWWQLISITIIGIIPLFYWLCKSGDAQANGYGTGVS